MSGPSKFSYEVQHRTAPNWIIQN